MSNVFQNLFARLFIAALLVSGIARIANAQFDGFGVSSSTFSNQYNGNQIWDGTNFVGDWTGAGGLVATDLSLNGTNLVMNQTTTNGWVQQDGGATAWEVGLGGSWTVEISMDLDIGAAVLWADQASGRSILQINPDATLAFPATTYDTNPNGNAQHTFRIAYTSSTDRYHYWRDNVQITPAAGIPEENNANNTRLIIGDCCGTLGGPGSLWELAYVRFDMTGAYSPNADAGSYLLSIDRTTGNVSLSNSSSTPLANILGYSIQSDAGGLNPTSWNKFSAGSPLANDNDTWTTLTSASNTVELAEAVLNTPGTGNGGDLSAGSVGTPTVINFGNVWTKSPFEDVVFELLLDDGTIIRPGTDVNGRAFNLTYTNGDAYHLADFNVNGTVDINDWRDFKAAYGSNVNGLTRVGAYFGGDINGDGSSNFLDFIAYRNAYDDANGAGAFAALGGTSVPEPATLGLLAVGGLALLGFRNRKRNTIRRNWEHSTMNRLFNSLMVGLTMALAMGWVTRATAITTFGFYSADVGNPATAMDIQSPELQGWIEWASGRQGQDPSIAIQEGIISGTTNAWLNSDPGSTNPGYFIDVDTADQTKMYGYGWEYEAVVSLVSGGQFSAFGMDGNNPWGAATNARVGFSFGNNGTNMTVTPVVGAGGSAVTAGTLNGQFARVVMTGEALSQNTTFKVFDFASGVQIGATQNTTGFAAGNATNANIFGIQSGSSAGTGNSAMIHRLSFKAFTPELVATVNRTTGEVTLSDSTSTVNFNFAGYSLSSLSNSLNSNNWNSLENQGVGDNAVPDDGIGFEELGTVGPGNVGELAEGNLLSSILGNGTLSYSLGNIYTGGMEDLKLTFTDANGVVLDGDVQYFTPSGLPGDYNLDGVVNAADYVSWRDKLGDSESTLNGNGNNSGGVVDGADYSFWRARFGNSSPGSATGAVVPEPNSGLIAILATVGLGCLRVSRKGQRIMKSARQIGSALALSLTLVSIAGATVTNDRIYLFGDDTFETGATAGNPMGIDFGGGPLTLDSEVADTTSPLVDAQDLTVVGAPTYILVDGNDVGGLPARPGAGLGTLGANLDGIDDTLSTLGFNSPDQYWDATDVQNWVTPSEQYPRNYDTIFNRGISFWVNPHSNNNDSAQHDIVRDTAEHGVVITENGTWGNAFDNVIFDSGVAVAFGQWHHVQVVSRNGAAGSILYVNGIAVEANTAVYDPSRAAFVIGSDLAGTGNFFKGVVDDMKVYLWGNNSGVPAGPAGQLGMDWGTFNLAEDNDIIKANLAGLNVTNIGDVNLDGSITIADATDFVGYYGFKQFVTGVTAGDWVSRQNGDLNYDGVTNLADAYILHNALELAGVNIAFSSLIGAGPAVPEPSASILALAGAIGFCVLRKTRMSKS